MCNLPILPSCLLEIAHKPEHANAADKTLMRSSKVWICATQPGWGWEDSCVSLCSSLTRRAASRQAGEPQTPKRTLTISGCSEKEQVTMIFARIRTCEFMQCAKFPNSLHR